MEDARHGRPIYETEADLAAESRIVASAAITWGLKMVPCAHKDGPFPRCDYYLENARGEVVAIAEAKHRNHPIHRYPSLMISLSKIYAGIYLAGKRGVPFHLLIEFERDIRTHRFLQNSFPQYGIAWGGRVDRDDPLDLEVCLFIPITRFVQLEEVTFGNKR
jgi:hypothetical protein